MLALPLADVGRSPAAAAQNCPSSVTLNNKVGQAIVGYVIFTSGDRNESGEGESMQVTSSGGELNINLTNFGVPVPILFAAKVANETITPTINGDGDEDCQLVVKAGNHTIPQKLAATFGLVVAGVAGLTALVMAVTAGGPGALLVLQQAVGLGALSLAGATWLIQIVIDPSDSNFKQLAPVQIPAVNPVTGTPPNLAVALTALMKVWATEDGVFQALVTTLNRAGSASDANDQKSFQMQMNYANQLFQREAALYALDAIVSRLVSGDLKGTDQDVLITSDQVLALETQIGSNGIPAFMLTELQKLGVTDQNTIAILTEILFNGDINASSGYFSSILSSSARLGALSNIAFNWGGPCGLVYLVNASLGTQAGQPGYNVGADLNNDGVVNTTDLNIALHQVPHGLTCELKEVNSLRPF
jgi:hypothetical protein